jgi:hypothetical protein
MDAIVLTDVEQELFDSLLGPPAEAVIKPTNIWIIEWLATRDQRTGRLLHEWMEERRPRWSYYSECTSKLEVLSAIKRATTLTRKYRMIPVIHFESHGSEIGLEGPDGKGGRELLSWDELNEPLQMLNLKTRCNLIVVVAACCGFAGIKAFTRGPLAPATALVGPNTRIQTNSLLYGTKEFYRRIIMDQDPRLDEMAISASREAGNVYFDWEPFAVLAYDAFAEQLIFSMREYQQLNQIKRIREMMYEVCELSNADIEQRLSLISQSFKTTLIQQLWDKMFMIDLYPENRERFGVNWFEIVDLVLNSKARSK